MHSSLKLEWLLQASDFVSIGAGADPGFLEGGFKSIKRGFVFNILPDFSYIST